MPVPNEDQVTYLDQAELDTGDLAIIENVNQGYSVLSGGAVTAQGTPNGTVAVASGTAKVAGAAVTISAGNVSVLSGSANPDGTTASAADGTLARFSLVTINSAGQLGVLHGAAAALSVNNDGSYLAEFPTFTGKTVLASVFIPPSFTTIESSMLSDKRIVRTDGDFVARVISPTALSAAANDYGPTGLATANVIRQATNNTTQRNISGIVPTGHADGKVIYLHNIGPGPLALLDESALSSAANRFALPNDIVIPVDRSILLQYDPTSSRWRVVGSQTAAAANTIVLGSAVVAGTSNYYLRSDDTIAAFDATVPAANGTAATGSAAFAARRDHVHPGGGLGTDSLWAAKGDLVAGTANDTAAVVPVGLNGQVLIADSSATSGVAWRDALLASLTTATSAISNTEAAILSVSLAANSLKVGDTFLVKAAGVGTTTTTPGSGTWRLRFNPTTLTGSSVSLVAPTLTASRTTKGWSVEFLMTVCSLGATGTVMGEGWVNGSNVSSNDLVASPPTLTVTTAPLTVDTTVANLLELTFVCATANGSIIAYTGCIRRL